jgi:glyoxylase-like metal-dependent hydrolase (beta-lactamase superfamily II)
MNNIDRRSFMQRTGIAGLSLLALNLGSNRAVADPDPAPGGNGPTPVSPSAEPDIYSFRIGSADAFVIHDGALMLPSIQPMFVPEAKPAEIEELQKKNFLPPNQLALSLNVLVVKGKSGVMLFDAGAGKAFGPGAGKLFRGLSRIGISPKDVKTVYVTHAHPDHIAGLVDDSNALMFPSARIVAAKTEAEFWTAASPDVSKVRIPPEMKTQSLETIKKIFSGLKLNLELKEPGKLSDEVELIPAPGHTPGHSLFMITQGDEKFLVIGDAVHVYALQFPHPEWTMAYDVDPALAIKTRLKLFKDVSGARTTVLGYHMPFPGIGHVRVDGTGYEWVPRPWVS